METINIRLAGDPVYFLSNNKGFVKGVIKKTLVTSERDWISCREGGSGYVATPKITYFVTCDEYNIEYVGDEKNSSELFDTKEGMIEYYLRVSKL